MNYHTLFCLDLLPTLYLLQLGCYGKSQSFLNVNLLGFITSTGHVHLCFQIHFPHLYQYISLHWVPLASESLKWQWHRHSHISKVFQFHLIFTSDISFCLFDVLLSLLTFIYFDYSFLRCHLCLWIWHKEAIPVHAVTTHRLWRSNAIVILSWYTFFIFK